MLLENNRSILLNNTMAKHHHRFFRSRMLSVCGHVILATQFGGMPRKGVDLASLTLVSTLSALRSLGRTALALFVDVKAAYYSVIRQLLFPIPTTPAELEDIIENATVPIAMVPLLQEILARPALFSAYSSKHLLALLTDIHLDTHFVTEGLETVAATSKGTRPGDPLADAAFNILLAPLLLEVRQAFVQLGVYVTIDSQGPNHFCLEDDPIAAGESDITLADDTVFIAGVPIGLPPEKLESLLAATIGSINASFTARGLQLNYDVGKCSALLFSNGKFARRYRQRILIDCAAQIKVPAWMPAYV